MSSFLEQMKIKVKARKTRIVLPEGDDPRTVEAAIRAGGEDLADLVILGDPALVHAHAKGRALKNCRILDTSSLPDLARYTDLLFEIRHKKGMTREEAARTVTNPLYYAALMLRDNAADGMVAGAANSTSRVMRPALQVVQMAPGVRYVSAFVIMVVPDCDLGEHGTFIFADASLNENPTAAQLAEIAVSSAHSFQQFLGREPRVAMLSYSTHGSAKSELTEKVIEATRLAREKNPKLMIDGELQLDAAIVERVARTKAPDSAVAGQANVLILPDLNSGNICYKLVERLAKATVYGGVTQGLAKPVNDLSRGCSADDVYNQIILTAVQA